MNWIGYSKAPIVKNIGGYAYKCSLFKDLYILRPDLFEYIYSCLSNMKGKRWCGRCDKCQRIAYYCEVFNIDKNLIGLSSEVSSKGITDKYKIPVDKFKE